MPAPDTPDQFARSFEGRWRKRFEEFAELRDDDAGIAGWSASGLETRLRFFGRVWGGAAPGSRWLDIGCGAGTYSRWLADRELAVIGLDYSQPTLDKAYRRLSPAITLCAGDATRLPFRDASFDGALCFGVLQAVSDTGSVLREIARVVKPGATLYVDALNREGLAARLSEVSRRWRGKRVHLRYESADRLEQSLAQSGFRDVARYWLPIAPPSLVAIQPMLESRVFVELLARVPLFGRVCSHSVLCTALR